MTVEWVGGPSVESGEVPLLNEIEYNADDTVGVTLGWSDETTSGADEEPDTHDPVTSGAGPAHASVGTGAAVEEFLQQCWLVTGADSVSCPVDRSPLIIEALLQVEAIVSGVSVVVNMGVTVESARVVSDAYPEASAVGGGKHDVVSPQRRIFGARIRRRKVVGSELEDGGELGTLNVTEAWLDGTPVLKSINMIPNGRQLLAPPSETYHCLRRTQVR
jgi:hypothetical protein